VDRLADVVFPFIGIHSKANSCITAVSRNLFTEAFFPFSQLESQYLWSHHLALEFYLTILPACRMGRKEEDKKTKRLIIEIEKSISVS
jgi:hypothetical protein